ncbi:hypothetical protein BGZ65_010330 [Modicella reniformis]|uniref:PPM-type phosphatase domain-containing protein n=1 Tax=Modicella reniformis TaxID=1440133 RepID=A0A9P6MAS1_9FUNG|nr:hypothetical protein BGZ65_010330 [Modicella reniformis]
MSLRLAATPPTVCHGHRLGRIQLGSRLAHPRFSFSTSTTFLSRYSRTPSSHREDGLPIKKIRRKAREAEFIDSPNAATTAGETEAVTSGSSRTATANTNTANTPFKSRVIPLRKDQQQHEHDSHHTKSRHGRVKTNRSDQEHAQSQQRKASRLRFEDFMPPRHHRLHFLHRQRVLYHLKQQQQRFQSRSHDSRDGHYHHDHHGGYDPRWNDWNHYWNPWMWHMIDSSRKNSAKAFLFGIVVAGMGIGIYESNSFHMEQWNKFVKDVAHIKNAFVEGGGPSATQFKSLSSGSEAAVTSKEARMTRGVPSLPMSQGLHASQKSLKMLTPEQVELRLGNHQRSFRIADPGKSKSKAGSDQDVVQGYCINQVASNNPIEDDLSRHIVRNGNGQIKRMFFGVFDGHSGWCCSQKVAQELAPSVAKELDTISNPGDTKAIVEAIERGFLKLDQRIVHESVKRVLEHPSRPLACSSLLSAISGSCALLAYVDPRENDLYIACTGDSRAVMGVRGPSSDGGHVWRAVPLSFDQTGRNRWEVKRLQEEHPGEESTVIMGGRVLGGLEPTRSFGDARYKWSKEIQGKVFQLFPTYRQPYRNYHTPPYVTAKPVVQHHKIQPEDRFLIMATDGLWDKLTSDEVVQLVGDLLDGKIGHDEMILDKEGIRKYKQQRRLALQESQLPTNGREEQTQQEEEEGELTPPKGPASQVCKFTYRDHANASTHLIRNALGGANDDKLAATLSIPSPMSRGYRDDITVVFFGQQTTTLALSDAQETDGCVEIR